MQHPADKHVRGRLEGTSVGHDGTSVGQAEGGVFGEPSSVQLLPVAACHVLPDEHVAADSVPPFQTGSAGR